LLNVTKYIIMMGTSPFSHLSHPMKGLGYRVRVELELRLGLELGLGLDLGLGLG